MNQKRSGYHDLPETNSAQNVQQTRFNHSSARTPLAGVTALHRGMKMDGRKEEVAKRKVQMGVNGVADIG